MNQQQVAVFGSAFNPPHLGHADVMHQVLQHTSSLILVPSYQHAFGKKMMPFSLRLQMLQAMLKDLNLEKRVLVSEIERDIAKRQSEAGKTSQAIYTYDVLEALEAELATDKLVFVVGPDNAAPETWRKFYRAEELTKRWELWAAEERLPVRSSGLREKLANNQALQAGECTLGVIALLKEAQRR